MYDYAQSKLMGIGRHTPREVLKFMTRTDIASRKYSNRAYRSDK